MNPESMVDNWGILRAFMALGVGGFVASLCFVKWPANLNKDAMVHVCGLAGLVVGVVVYIYASIVLICFILISVVLLFGFGLQFAPAVVHRLCDAGSEVAGQDSHDLVGRRLAQVREEAERRIEEARQSDLPQEVIDEEVNYWRQRLGGDGDVVSAG